MEERSNLYTNDYPIGVFDSGVGGLTVALALQRQLPRESIVYFGDRARCPYGDKAPHEVRAFAAEIARFLLCRPVKCIVVACNTATAAALPELQKECSVPVIGVIAPGATSAVEWTKSGTIGVIGTTVTIESHAYKQAIQQIDPSREVVELACPEFVPLVEAGLFDGPGVEWVVEHALAPISKLNIATLVLGCTHYPMLFWTIQQVLGQKVRLISSADATADAVSDMLQSRGLLKTSTESVHHEYFTTGDGSKMRLALANWFGAAEATTQVTQVCLPLSLDEETPIIALSP